MFVHNFRTLAPIGLNFSENRMTGLYSCDFMS